MSRIYISGPMTGIPEWNYPAFHDAAHRLRVMGWTPINPAESFGGATDRPYREYVEEDLRLLQQANAIYLLPGWDGPGARGSVWEWAVATKLFRLPVYNE